MKRAIAHSLLGGCLMAALVGPVALSATTLTGFITADEIANAYLSTSGTHVGERFILGDSNRETVETGTVELVEGQVYYLHIVAAGSRAWPAFFVGSFSLSDNAFAFPNSSQEIVTKADYWRLSLSGFPRVNSSEIKEIPVYESSWGNLNGIDPDAKVLTSLGAVGGHVFTLVISPKFDRQPHSSLTYQPSLNNVLETTLLDSALPRQFSSDENGNYSAVSTDPGRLSAFVYEKRFATQNEHFTSITSEFTSFDFVLSSDSGLSSTEVSLNLELNGSIYGGVGRPNSIQESSVSTSEIEITAQVADEPPFTGKATIVGAYEINTGNPNSEISISATGALREGFPKDYDSYHRYFFGNFVTDYQVVIDEIITTPTYTLPVGVPFQVKLKLSATSSLPPEGISALSVIDLHSGLAFPSERLVFNLPPGVSVNSLSANIRDNRFEIPSSSISNYKDLVPGIFLRIPDIPGESQSYDHDDWIDLLELSSSLLTMGQGPQSGTFEDIQFVKQVDKSSPKLIEALTQGLALEVATIEYNRQEADNTWTQFEFLLHDVTVTDYQLIGDGIEDSRLREAFSLSYEKIDWINRLRDARGFEQRRIVAFWDFLTNTGGSFSVSNDNNPPLIGQVDNQSVEPGSTNLIDLNIEDLDTDLGDLSVTVSTSRSDLIGDLQVNSAGADRTLSYKASTLRSGFASITLTVSDGKDTRSTSIPVLINVEMTPYEGYLAAYFDEEDRIDLDLTSPIRDPDHDNIPTVIEFLLGTNPKEFNRPSEGVKTFIQDSPEGRVFTVDFKKRLDDPKIRAHLWGSYDLKNWQRLDSSNPIYKESSKQGENPIFEETRATVTLPSENEEPFYLRLQAEDVF